MVPEPHGNVESALVTLANRPAGAGLHILWAVFEVNEPNGHTEAEPYPIKQLIVNNNNAFNNKDEDEDEDNIIIIIFLLLVCFLVFVVNDERNGNQNVIRMM
jgi:hypothetical protein